MKAAKGLMVAVAMVVTVLSLGTAEAPAQIIPMENQRDFTDSLRREFDRGPYFTLYKDNYFLVGTAPFRKPTAENSDVKFQISISQRLTKSVLPWHTYLFLMYTQRVVWDVFKNSMPMHDFVFNPGIGLSKPLFSKDRFIGKATLLIEHESNGRDGVESRSWNRISLGASIMIDNWITVHGKVWIPIVDGENNRDILKYAGLWSNGVTINTPNKKFFFGVTLTKRAGWNLNFNTQVDFGWRIWNNANQYLYVQYYNGYAENLLDYNKFESMFRIGLVIKPKFFSEL